MFLIAQVPVRPAPVAKSANRGGQAAENISGSTKPLPTTLSWSETLHKRVRSGDWQDQAVSTTQKIREAIDGSEWESRRS